MMRFFLPLVHQTGIAQVHAHRRRVLARVVAPPRGRHVLSFAVVDGLGEIVTMDQLDATDLDGAEISSELFEDDDPSITFTTILNPARSRPGHGGV
jgi:hypothetical protein